MEHTVSNTFQRLWWRLCRTLGLCILFAPISLAQAQGVPSASISGGVAHTCALTAAGGVQCWGQGNRLGLAEDADDRTTPGLVPGLTSGVRALAAGDEHTCALTAAGGVVCWSDNTFGELGDGTTTFRPHPVAVAGLSSGVASLTAGGNAACAVLTTGGISCWGTNDAGERGDGTTDERDAPTAVVNLGGPATAVATRGGHACAVLASGAVRCWGRGFEGQLGNGASDSHTTPVAVFGLASGARAIAVGGLHSCATLAAGGVTCWGRDESGELGDGKFSASDRLKPVMVLGLSEPVAAITAGYAHTCILTTAGGVKCWGTNQQGQLGDGTNQPRNTPVDVVGLQSGVVAIGAGQAHTCAILATGAIVCWGDNAHGQLGDGTQNAHPTPVTVQPPHTIWLPLVLR